MRARQAFIEATGGPEVIQWREVDLPAPGPGEVLLRHEAVGLNFIDTYHRSGLYPVALPAPLGSEAAGVIEAVGPDVTEFRAGDRIATFSSTRGAYATARIMAARDLFHLPEYIDFAAAAAVMLKGCTTEFLAERAARPQAGDWVLVHAAAGGVGQLLVQWLAALGVRVIGTVGSEAKASVAREAGAEIVLLSGEADLAERICAATGDAGVSVAYDGVGVATWETSLKATRRRGLIVSFGNASGAVTGVNLGTLSTHGSLFVTRPTLFDYYVTPEERRAGVERLWDMLRSGKVKVSIGQTFPLADATRAHAALEARATTGSTVLLP